MFFLLLSLLFSPSDHYEIQFFETEVFMPLGSNPYDYTEIPYAKVFKNGQEVIGARLIYERGVERTFLSVLHTKDVKSFYIKYRVHAPDYKLSQTTTITFSVYDDIAPKITLKHDLIYGVGQKIQLLEAFTFEDNYNDRSDLYVYIFDAEVNINRVGSYEVIVLVRDQSMNERKETFTVEVKDFEPPTIDIKKDMIIDIFTTLDIQQFVTVKDNQDQNLIIELDTSNVHFDQLGSYIIGICVKDTSLNQSCITTMITLIDRIPPELTLISYVPTIEVNTLDAHLNLQDFIVSVKDNVDDIHLDDVSIQSDLNVEKIGQYTIVYSVEDHSNNKTSIPLKVNVKDTTPPIITHIEPLVFDVNASILPWGTYMTIEDNYDPLLSIETRFESNVNIKQIGIYTLEVQLKDVSKNQATYIFYVEVVDRIPPQVDIQEPVIISNFSKPDYGSIIKVTDNYASFAELHIVVYDDDIPYDTVGMYHIEMHVIDPSLNITKVWLEVMIVDVIPPQINLITNEIILDVMINTHDFRDYIESVHDNISELDIEDVIIHHQVQFGTIGKYDVIYELSDDSYTKTSALLEVYIDVLTKYDASNQDLFFYQGDNIHLLDALTYEPLYIKNMSMYYDEKLFYESGIYEVIFVLYDVAGHHQVLTSLITVEEKPLQQALKAYLPMGSTLIIGLILSIVLKVYFGRTYFDKHQQFNYNKYGENRQEN